MVTGAVMRDDFPVDEAGALLGGGDDGAELGGGVEDSSDDRGGVDEGGGGGVEDGPGVLLSDGVGVEVGVGVGVGEGVVAPVPLAWRFLPWWIYDSMPSMLRDSSLRAEVRATRARTANRSHDRRMVESMSGDGGSDGERLNGGVEAPLWSGGSRCFTEGELILKGVRSDG